MQFNTFELGEELKLSFNLSVSGTSAQPSEVRVVLGNGLKLQTLARLGNSGEWEASLPILPDLFLQGDTTLQIEVVVNGKLFTPIKQRVTIIGATVSVNAQTAIAEPVVQEPEQAAEPVSSFGSTKHELVSPPPAEEPVIASGKFISQAELLAAAGIKVEAVKKPEENKPITAEAVKKETVVEQQQKPESEKQKIKFVKEQVKPVPVKKALQFDFKEFADLHEHVAVPEVETIQEERKKVKVSTGNFRIQKTKIVTR